MGEVMKRAKQDSRRARKREGAFGYHRIGSLVLR